MTASEKQIFKNIMRKQQEYFNFNTSKCIIRENSGVPEKWKKGREFLREQVDILSWSHPSTMCCPGDCFCLPDALSASAHSTQWNPGMCAPLYFAEPWDIDRYEWSSQHKIQNSVLPEEDQFENNKMRNNTIFLFSLIRRKHKLHRCEHLNILKMIWILKIIIFRNVIIFRIW